MFGAMTSEPEGTCYASTYDSASQQYLRSGSNPQHTCRIYPCLNLLEWALNVRRMNLFLPPFSSLFKVIGRHERHEDQNRVTPAKASPCKVANEAIANEAKGAKWPFTLPKVPKAKGKGNGKAGTKDTSKADHGGDNNYHGGGTKSQARAGTTGS